MQQLVLSARTVLAYAAPALGCGYMYLLVSLYVMFYSTDVLLMPPAVIAGIFSASRIINAISDPLIGHISDRTRSRFGRRRFWMLLSVLPTALLFYMMFAPPAGIGGAGLTIWMAVAVIGYYVAINFCFIPHLSLGAEISNDNHQRNRLFGFRHAGYTFGSVLALFALQAFVTAQQQGAAAVQTVAATLAIVAGLGFAALVIFSASTLEERPDYAGSVQSSFFASITHVWNNPHARLLLIVTFIENIGLAAITALSLYITEYVVGRPELAALVILTYLGPSAAFAPLWSRVARRVGKVRLWMYSMTTTAVVFGALFPVLYFGGGLLLPGLFTLLFLAGLAAGCGGSMGPSVQSDVIDYDELQTGERKEGTYFSVWDFVFKSAIGVMALVTGFTLQITGYVPNAEQAPAARLAMIVLFSVLPMLCYAVGALLFSRFKLDEKAHAEILESMGKSSPSIH
jgi:GPH family glycoside/pentoside/hexuronide:cation symporter